MKCSLVLSVPQHPHTHTYANLRSEYDSSSSNLLLTSLVLDVAAALRSSTIPLSSCLLT